MIEQLHATELRIAEETAPGSGETAGSWWTPPLVGAAARREIAQTISQHDIWRQPRPKVRWGEAWSLMTAHEVGIDWLSYLIKGHCTDRGEGVYTLDPEAEGPTYVLEVEFQDGGRQAYLGLKLQELAIQYEQRRIASISCQWSALQRLTGLEYELPEADETSSGSKVAAWEGRMIATAGEWGADPATDNALTAHAVQIFLRRASEAADYGPDGVPVSHTRSAWAVLVESIMPEAVGITDQASDSDWIGKVGVFLGTGTEQLRVNNAQGFVADEELKAYDFRARRLVLESLTDNDRTVLEFRV